MSPYANFMAILTAHTVRIILLPDPSHLTAPTVDAIKPKSWSLGPTTHADDRSPVASALWHPLGVNGSSLVTVTKDAVVRMWELSQKDRWSFDAPTLTIDLQKLADGISLDQNFSANDGGTKGFSPDSFEMDVAAAAFAGRGSGGWSPMTLWIAMRGGDVYALCPLLPTQWAPPPTLIPSLSISIVGNLGAIEDDPSVSEQAKLLAQQQLDWMSDLDNQEPRVVEGPPGEPPTEIYTRPSRPGVVPRLQGPFVLDSSPKSEDDLDLELTDIYVIGEKLDTDELMFGEDEELEMEGTEGEGLSLSVICLLSSSGQVQICLDVEGIQAQWLPPRNKSRTMGRLVGSPTLLTFTTLDTLNPLEVTEDAWPVFSTDITSRYSFYITHPSSITYISLSPWVFRLENELQGDSEAGSDFRINLLVNGQASTRERLYNSTAQGDTQLPLSAAVAIQDPDLGYFLLSATPFGPIALIFETPEDDFLPIRSASPSFSKDAEVQPLEFFEPRPVYQPSHAFEDSSALPTFIERLRTSRHKTIMNQEIRLSPLTLQLFTEAHQILSDETHRLGIAASEVFRRCVKLQDELKEQITKANEVKARVEAITGEDSGEGSESEPNNAAIEKRLQEAKERGEALSRRLENMRKTVNKATSRELSKKEQDWVKEVKALDAGIFRSADQADGPNRAKQIMERYQKVMELKAELAEQAKVLEAPAGEREGSPSLSGADLRIPSELRRVKIGQVKSLLDRETALVEAVKSRLERLAFAG
jgi:nucleoporin NUP82